MNPSTRILLVEDDATSRAFMTAALENAGIVVDGAACIADAMALIASDRHALWLVDAHLPDGSGIDFLMLLRAQNPMPPALAHTASHDSALHDALHRAGFAEVIVKPLTATALLQRVTAFLPDHGAVDAAASSGALWDDAAALRALAGQPSHVAALRALFVAELPDACERIAHAIHAGTPAVARAELHRLQASCGFVGALRMAGAVRCLSRTLDKQALAELQDAARRTLEHGCEQRAEPASRSVPAGA